jgi:two-component system cell cycle response regulator CpdR
MSDLRGAIVAIAASSLNRRVSQAADCVLIDLENRVLLLCIAIWRTMLKRLSTCPSHELHPKFTNHGAYWVPRFPHLGSTFKAMHKILLAEDDNDMRRFLVKALENAGFSVSHHDNGMSAYQRLREEPFEMLLTDIVMPEMDGIELARRASELDPDIKIMFITGFAAVALNSDSEAPKNAKVLAKPVHLRELVSEVNKMLAA